MKASYKMRKAIERYEKKAGPMQKDFFVESDPMNRVGRGFYDGCVLYSPGFPTLTRTVNHQGEIFNL